MIHSLYVDEKGAISTDLPVEEFALILQGRQGLLWVDMEKPRQREGVDILSGIFKFHPLAVEDCFHPLQYPRIDAYNGYIFVVVHGLGRNGDGDGAKLGTRELDFFVGPNYVVTFHADPLPAIDHVRESSIKDSRKLRRGSDWLAHDVLDALVDGYLPVINELSDRLEDLESKALENPQHTTLAQIMEAKREVLAIHRVAIPLRETINRFSREDLDNIRLDTRIYFRDIYDHMVRITETSEVLREVAEGALTIYAMAQNNKINDITRVLTTIATVALPAILVASIYGMNFKHMPELEWKYGYAYSLGVIAALSLGLWGFFRFKKWL